MGKPALHFAHANGIPAGTYRLLFEELEKDFQIHAIPQLAHNPNYPITNGWGHLQDELIEYIESRCSSPIIGIGHSLGGTLTFLAAQKRPDLFSELILLDPPLATGILGLMVKLGRPLGLMDKLTPAGKSRKRRTQWDSEQQAFEQLKTKGLYRSWPEASIKDYIRSATRHTPSGIELSYEVDKECAIFHTIPTFLEYLPALDLPCSVIYGETSDVCTPLFHKPFAKRHHASVIKSAGDHMFPIQFPQQTARLILEQLNTPN